MLAVVLAGLLAVPIDGGARPASFKSWSVRWSARTARDNARVVDHCAKLFGGSDLKFGMCKNEKGESIELSHSSFSSFLRSPDRNVRRKAEYSFSQWRACRRPPGNLSRLRASGWSGELCVSSAP